MAGINGKWLDALRSGKYKQTKQMLRDKQGFCCLGVGCDVVDPTCWLDPVSKSGEYAYRGYDGKYEAIVSSLPPRSVVEALGLSASVFAVAAVAAMNDEKGKSFVEIADYLEEKYGRDSQEGTVPEVQG